MITLPNRDDNIDRRQYLRHRTQRQAELLVPDGKGGYSCAVIDQSDGGVQVETPQALDLPKELTIRFHDTSSQLVRRCWSAGARAGYQYIEIIPVQRRWLDDGPLPPMPLNTVAIQRFVEMSQALLNLSDQLAEDALSVENFNSILSEFPHARIQFQEWGSTGLKTLQLVAIPGVFLRLQSAEALHSVSPSEVLRLK